MKFLFLRSLVVLLTIVRSQFLTSQVRLDPENVSLNVDRSSNFTNIVNAPPVTFHVSVKWFHTKQKFSQILLSGDIETNPGPVVPPQDSQWNALPLELFEMITQYFSYKDCVRLQRVNHWWRDALLEECKRRREDVDVRKIVFKKFRVAQMENTNGATDIITTVFENLAVKIYPYVRNIRLEDYGDGLLSGERMAQFLKKLYELSPPDLDYLYLELLREKSSYEIGKYLPTTLTYLYFKTWDCHFETFDLFSDENVQTFTQLTRLKFEFYRGSGCIRFDALKTPNLAKIVIRTKYEFIGDIIVENLHRLTNLKWLELDCSNKIANKLLKGATRDGCQFRQSLKKLTLRYGFRAQILERIALFEGLIYLTLDLYEINKDEVVNSLRVIGRGCPNLRSLSIYEPIGDDALAEIADNIHSLRNIRFLFDFGKYLTLENIKSFCWRLPTGREMEIRCRRGPTRLEVEESRILNSHPNIRYIPIIRNVD